MHPETAEATSTSTGPQPPPHKRRVRAVLPPSLWDRLSQYADEGGFTSPHHAAVELIRRGLFGEPAKS